jgi:hypothetical protein
MTNPVRREDTTGVDRRGRLHIRSPEATAKVTIWEADTKASSKLIQVITEDIKVAKQVREVREVREVTRVAMEARGDIKAAKQVREVIQDIKEVKEAMGDISKAAGTRQAALHINPRDIIAGSSTAHRPGLAEKRTSSTIEDRGPGPCLRVRRSEGTENGKHARISLLEATEGGTECPLLRRWLTKRPRERLCMLLRLKERT